MRATLEVLRQTAAKATAAPVLLACLFLSECERVYSAWIDVDLQGGRSPVCENEEFPPVRGPRNMIVSAHATQCETYVVYVYLHDASVPDRSSNQIFRYDGSSPVITWVGSDHVSISVSRVRDVTKQAVYLDGIRIGYNITLFHPGE